MFSMLSWVCSLTSVTHPCVPLFCSNHFTDIICDLLMNRHTAVKLILGCSKLALIGCQTENIREYESISSIDAFKQNYCNLIKEGYAGLNSFPIS